MAAAAYVCVRIAHYVNDCTTVPHAQMMMTRTEASSAAYYWKPKNLLSRDVNDNLMIAFIVIFFFKDTYDCVVPI